MSALDLHLYLSELFWLLLSFGSLYLVVWKVIAPAADRIVNNRQNTIEGHISMAQSLADKTKALRERYNEELEKISCVIEVIKKDAQDSLEKSFAEKKTRLNDELKLQIQHSSLDIESSKISFWQEDEGACINLAAFLIQMITDQPANLELLKKSYNKIK
jgi:F-type H+-transporting ATPase subunit b